MSRWVLRPPVESWGELFLESMNKVARRKTSKYTTISNVFLRDKNLSLKAKGFLTVVMALPDDWDFSIKGICSILKEGKSSIYGVVQELKENRYCKTTAYRDEKGLILGLDYMFYEEPYEEEPQQDNPHTENRDMDNMPQLNTKDEKVNNRTKDLPKEERIDKSIPKKKADNDVDEFVDRMYALYPAKCPKRGAYLGKSQKDKVKIKSLLKTYSESDIEFVIRWEIAQKYNKAYMLNFSTFLNNFPDPTQIDGYNKLNNTSTNTITLPKGWTQERYDMYIRNGYTITDDGRLFKDGKEYK